MRLLIQSRDTGRFLVPDAMGGGAEWVLSLRDAGGGVIDDPEVAVQVAQEWAELDERVQIIDLERLGTADDYTDGATAAAAPLRSGGAAVDGASAVLPDGNHGENQFSGGAR